MISTGKFRVVRRLYPDSGRAVYVIQEQVKFLFWTWWADEIWGMGTYQRFDNKGQADVALENIINARRHVDKVVTQGYV